jgi:hypothetical protein
MKYLINIVSNYRTLYFRKCLENAKNRIKNNSNIPDGLDGFKQCEVCSNTISYQNCWFCNYNIFLDMKIIYNIIQKNRVKPKLPNFKLLDASQFNALTFRDLMFISNIYGILIMDNTREKMIYHIIKSNWDITMQEFNLYK